ncbi:MAG: radical SAM family heme chaperone HemW [Bacteroidales bacterium]|nr:radical SAM family heme chaperone HemW [Bacteroidales bacterium]
MIYVHIPFCRSFCTYCDFYSEVAAKCRSFGRFADALVKEIEHRANEITDDVNTLYIGGGTPSVLPLDVLERILDALRRCGHGGPYDEFTVEVNPEDIVEKGPGYVEGLLKLGVNRISMGVQSFDDGILKFMNRRHDAETARKAYAILEGAGVENISIDLIFGLPQLSDVQWQDTLDKALSISGTGRLPKHISSYQLSVEPGSMLARLVEKGRFEEASEELCERQYSMLCAALRDAGYRHYEISNFALPGYEARHNSAYWKHVPYVGFGPGAHSLVSPQSVSPIAPEGAYGLRSVESHYSRTWNEADLNRYLEDPMGVRDGEELTRGQVVMERIMLALRTSEGIPEEFLRMHCAPHELEHALACGNLVRIPDCHGTADAPCRLRIPEDRFFVSDSIIPNLV